MIRNKTFDCVEMKNRAQAKLQKEYEGLMPEEIRKRRRARIEISDDPLARKWRRLIQSQRVNETPAHHS
jgi:hypothetical protein